MEGVIEHSIKGANIYIEQNPIEESHSQRLTWMQIHVLQRTTLPHKYGCLDKTTLSIYHIFAFRRTFTISSILN
jgi:hypothetical protein